MAMVEKPSVPEVVKPFFHRAEITALLHGRSGQDVESRRDAAIVRILIDTAVRVSGLAGLRFSAEDDDKADVFLRLRRLRVTLKGGDQGGFRSAAGRPWPSTATCGPGRAATTRTCPAGRPRCPRDARPTTPVSWCAVTT